MKKWGNLLILIILFVIELLFLKCQNGQFFFDNFCECQQQSLSSGVI